jgi:hypothetical protein
MLIWCAGWTAQRAFRQTWATGKFDAYEKKNTITKSKVESFWKVGTFRSLSRIAVEEGSGRSGWQSAVQYAMSCFELGDGWCSRYLFQIKPLFDYLRLETTNMKHWGTIFAFSCRQ